MSDNTGFSCFDDISLNSESIEVIIRDNERSYLEVTDYMPIISKYLVFKKS
jgi:hypothetical protein